MYIAKLRVFKTTKNLSVSPTKASKGKVKYIQFLKTHTEFKTHYTELYVSQQLSMYIFTYIHMYIFKTSYPLVQIYLPFEHHLYQIYLDSSSSGYLSEVSSVKLSKGKKRTYFNFTI